MSLVNALQAAGSRDVHTANMQFVVDLEQCIVNHAHKLALTFPQWGDKCEPVTSKVDIQAKICICGGA